jgi:hypothetical protein
MVLLSVNTPEPAGGQVTKKILGEKVARKLKGISASHRALLASDLVNGKVDLSHLTLAQAKAITQVSGGYTATAMRLTVEQRKQVERREVSLSAFHNKPAASVTEEMISRFIEKAGAGRVLDAIDRLTAPTTLVA